jgi:uncharacterized Fe-S center protein
VSRPRSAAPARARRPEAEVRFASVAVDRVQSAATLPAKLERLLKTYDLKRLAGGGPVPIKMHLGGGNGYTTVHPVFVRTVVQAVKDAGGEPFVVDGYFATVRTAHERGYTAEVLGCPLVAAGGPYDRQVVTRPIGYRGLDEVGIFTTIRESPCLINLSHVKGHGDCGFGGACKNLAMGCVDQPTRARIHALEGGIRWIRETCTYCGRCVKACDTGAITLERSKKKLSIFFHHCRYCRHCVAACPTKSLVMDDRNGFVHFQEGMALTTREVLAPFEPGRVLHVNVLLNITMFCDCWGMSTANVVPDIGILASPDIVAVEAASLAAIESRHFLPGSLVGKWRMGKGRHLLERIHGKDPFVQLRALERHGLGTTRYRTVEVR